MTMTIKTSLLLTIGLIGLVGAAPARAAQTVPVAATYVDENGTDPAPLKLDNISGRVRGLGGDAMTGAKVSLFTEVGHALIATVISDKDGKFRFAKVDKGFYRVVARVEGLCTANIPIRIDSSILEHRKLEITMQPKDIDTCSYAVTKK
jgi:hypothetical protein